METEARPVLITDSSRRTVSTDVCIFCLEAARRSFMGDMGYSLTRVPIFSPWTILRRLDFRLRS